MRARLDELGVARQPVTHALMAQEPHLVELRVDHIPMRLDQRRERLDAVGHRLQRARHRTRPRPIYAQPKVTRRRRLRLRLHPCDHVPPVDVFCALAAGRRREHVLDRDALRIAGQVRPDRIAVQRFDETGSIDHARFPLSMASLRPGPRRGATTLFLHDFHAAVRRILRTRARQWRIEPMPFRLQPVARHAERGEERD